MRLIPIQALSNQSLSITIENNYYQLAIYQIEDSGLMAMDINRNNALILSGQRLVPGYVVIPYPYLEAGNFIFNTMNDEYPTFSQFGTTQFLYYITIAELAALRA